MSMSILSKVRKFVRQALRKAWEAGIIITWPADQEKELENLIAPLGQVFALAGDKPGQWSVRRVRSCSPDTVVFALLITCKRMQESKAHFENLRAQLRAIEKEGDRLEGAKELGTESTAPVDKRVLSMTMVGSFTNEKQRKDLLVAAALLDSLSQETEGQLPPFGSLDTRLRISAKGLRYLFNLQLPNTPELQEWGDKILSQVEEIGNRLGEILGGEKKALKIELHLE